jgi:hypothetical protein
MEKYIENPKSGRLIRMNGDLYKSLKSKVKFDKSTITMKPKKSEPKQISPKRTKISHPFTKQKAVGSRGWSSAKPGRRERHSLKKKCGDECFLDPVREKYPICPKNKCEIDCRGLLAAKVRASEWHQYKIAKKADTLGKRAKCSWTK